MQTRTYIDIGNGKKFELLVNKGRPWNFLHLFISTFELCVFAETSKVWKIFEH